MPVIRRLLHRLADESGNTMATVMGVMMVGGILVAAAIAAPNGDTHLSRYDQDYKDGYAAAEAGVAEYVFHLTQDNGYWVRCAGTVTSPLPSPNAVNQPWNGSGADPRKWRVVPGTTKNLYTIELIPQPPYTQCDTSNPSASMIDDQAGTFRIRATGCANSRSTTTCVGGAKRSIVVTFRRRGFLDYLWFTDYETSDAVWYDVDVNGRATRISSSNPLNLVDWAAANCNTRWWRDGRGSLGYNGQVWNPGTNSWNSYSDNCSEIQFANADVLAGPFHTNDSILTCGSPDFGRTNQDSVEVSGPTPGWRSAGGCSGSPNFIGKWSTSAPLLTMPPSEASLKAKTDAAYIFTGRTRIVFNGTNVNITNTAAGLNNASMAYPPNGIIYVQNGTCGQGYKPLQASDGLYPNTTSPTGDAPEGCGDAIVKGTYGKDVTISAEKDIVANDDVISSSDSLLGLIANGFIRVYHPVLNRSSGATSATCDNASSTSGAAELPYGNPPGSIEIDAAILSLQHSFTVDNYYCGNPLGTLTVKGAIAQKYRGPVGRGSGTSPTNGYIKNYSYDDRLRFRSPPHFLDPVQTAWKVMRQTEQTPAR